jgi:hypothetical protein
MSKQLKDIVKSYLDDLKELSDFVTGEAIAIKELFNDTVEDLGKEKKLVSNYLNSLDRMSSRTNRVVKLLARLLYSVKTIDFRKTQIEKRIDSLLDDFDLTHRVHVKEFWEIWIPRLIDITDTESKHKLISTETKKEFNIYRVGAIKTISNLSKSVTDILKIAEQFDAVYKKVELEKLKNLTLDAIMESWELDMNPVTGELYDDIIR